MEILRYAAFTSDPAGGNPAGVVPDASGLGDAEMQQIATDLGYSETAFVFPLQDLRIRYFSPLAEVDFCGHATIATAVALADRNGPMELVFRANPGPIAVSIAVTDDGPAATLTSVPPRVAELSDELIGSLLHTLGLRQQDLDPLLPIREVFSGNLHPVVPVTAAALDALDHDHDRLGALMARHGWGATVAVVHRRSDTEWVVRNPFPPGGIREDPATGSAAAALGGYLRDLGLVTPPARVTIDQGTHIGRPCRIVVDIPVTGGIAVTGHAVPLSP